MMAELEAMVAQGIAHLEAGLLAEAIGVLSQAIAQEPRHAVAYRWRARAYEKADEIDSAEADLTTAIAVKPEDADTYVERAIFLRAHGGTALRLLVQGQDGEMYLRAPGVTLEARLTDVTQALALNPALAAAYLHRGIAYYTAAQPERAIADLSQAIALHPDCHKAFFWRGMARKDQGMQRQRDAPPRPGYVSIRGNLYHDRRVLEEAIADFSRAIALHPDYFYLDQRAMTWMTMGEWQQAIRDCEDLLTRPHLGMSQIYRNRAVTGIAVCYEALKEST